MLKQLKKLSSPNREVNQLQENVEQAINPIIDKSLIDGILIENVLLITGTTNSISHKLNRKLKGYIVTKKNANSIIWDEQDSNINTTTTLNLQCSANTTIDLWVF